MEKKEALSRREFLRGATGTLMGFSAFSSAESRSANGGMKGKVTSQVGAADKVAIEPYDPAVKRRVVFTDWRHINPGWFEWVDDKGTPHGTRETFEVGALRFRPHNRPYGLRLVAQQAEHVGPILKPEHPWENMGVCIQTVICEKGIYRAWGVCNPELMENYLCYLESKDGMTWERPKVGLFEFRGSSDNNLLMSQGWNRAVFVDPTAPPEERYKMITGDRAGVCAAVSSEGLRWTDLPEPILRDASDTQNIAYYDEALHKYVLYHRKFVHERRAVGRSESADFRNFPPSDLILEAIPDDMPACVDLYTNCRTTIPGAPDHHLMFPTVYHRDQDLGSLAIASSHDGRLWHFLAGSPVWTARPDKWDRGWTTASPNLLELADGSFALPYVSCNMPHKYPRGKLKYWGGYAVWPKGRIVALEAPKEGEFTILGISVAAKRELRINAVTAPKGSVRVEAVGAPGRSFTEANPIVGDHHRTLVTWKNHHDLGLKEDEGITLRFRMQKARIFGLEFQ